MAESEVLVVIPARSGSKGIPGKNVIDLGGRPLIAYSILQALQCRLVDRVIVSTDSEEIAAIARQWGAETPFLRDQALSGDSASVHDALIHALNELLRIERYRPDCVCSLFPTSPFRPKGLLDRLLEKSLEGYGVVQTVCHLPETRLNVFGSSDGSALDPLYDDDAVRVEYCHPIGCATILNLRPFRGTYVHVLDNPCALVDIDTWEDYRLARAIVEKGWYDLEKEVL